MATRTINTKIAFEGEKEYKKAISDINSGLGVLNSEMRKVTAQYKDNADSVEALTAKNDVLQRKLTTQKEKVDELRKALAEAAKNYGEADSRTMEWQKKLNDAEAAVYDTESAIKANNEAIEELNSSGTGLGDVLDGLTEKFGVSLPDGLKTSLNGIKGFSETSVAAIGAVTAAVAALVKVEQELIQMTTESAAYADEVLTMAQITGLDEETIQEMQYAAELIDVSFETIKSSMTKMKRNMNDARDGNEDLAQSFEELGVSITDADGELRNAEDVFYDAIDALGEIENATERDAVAMEIFGRSAENLNPLIIQGSDTLKAYAEEAHNVSAVLNDEELAALGAVDDAYQRMMKSQDAIKNQISAEMAPAVEQFYTSWSNLMTTAGEALIDSGVIDGLRTLLEIFNMLVDVVSAVVETAFPNIKSSFEDVGDTIYWIGLRLASFIDALKTLNNFVNPIAGLVSVLSGNGLVTSSTTEAYRQAARSNVAGFTYDESTGMYVGNGYNAAGDSNWRGGLTWVGENGPELVSLPSGSGINSAQESAGLGGNTYNITIDAKSVKEFNDIVRIAQQSRITARMRG